MSQETLETAEALSKKGLEARAQGRLDDALAFYQEAMEAGTEVEALQQYANICDIHRLNGDFDEADDWTSGGLTQASLVADDLDIDIENGIQDLNPDNNGDQKKFWFGYAKILNFEALTYRARYGETGIESHLKQSMELNGKAHDICTRMGHGYARKIVNELVGDLVESDDQDDILEGIHMAEAQLPEHQHHRYMKMGKGLTKLSGFNEDAQHHYLRALAVATKSGNERVQAGVSVEITGWFLQYGEAGRVEAELYIRNILDNIDYVNISDIGYHWPHWNTVYAHLEATGRADQVPTELQQQILKVRELRG